ncbi:MAG TPA: ribonuclease HI family protein [Patescibacteria group bacterium]|nr:ribonuclease HI family protein [Patescibacteria group bacterium]
MKIITYTDGGSRGNPGPAASGIYIQDELGNELTRFGTFLGIQTNNFAEYTAIIEALSWITTHRQDVGELTNIECRMDSQLACRQLSGIYRVKHEQIRPLFAKVQHLQQELAVPFSFVHVPREHNKIADSEVNRALDNHMASSIQ